MNTSKYRFTLDMQSEISQISLPVREQDNTRELLINLTDSGTPYFIEDGCYAYFVSINKEGKVITMPCTIQKNTVICVSLDASVTYLPGVVECEIRLYGIENDLITSPRFILVVNNRVTRNGDYVIPEGTKDFLDQVNEEEVKRVDAEIQRSKKFAAVVADVEETNAQAKAVLEDANTALVNVNTALHDANEVTSAANEAFNSANDALQSANDALNEAENAKDAALEAAGITVSPEVSVVSIANGHRVTIKDVNGTRTFDVMNGERGQDGEDGKDGEGVKIETGSYVGVGVTSTGKSKKTLTFDFSPKIVVVQSVSTDSLSTGLFVNGCNRVLNFNSGGTASIAKTGASWGEKTITMSSTSSYGDATMAEEAFNAVDVTYNYVAIG